MTLHLPEPAGQGLTPTTPQSHSSRAQARVGLRGSAELPPGGLPGSGEGAAVLPGPALSDLVELRARGKH